MPCLWAFFLAVFPARNGYAARDWTEVAVTGGYRQDRLETSSGPGPYFWRTLSASPVTPNVMTELTWKNLRIFQLESVARILTRSRVYVRGNLSYGVVLAGDYRHSEYGGDNRMGEWSRADLDANNGHTLNASYAAGYKFPRDDDEPWMLAPMLGFAYSSQVLKMEDGTQSISSCAPNPPFVGGVCPHPAGAIEGKRERFTGEWYGPWSGLDFAVATGRWRFNAEGEYHWSNRYYGYAHFDNYPIILGLEFPTTYRQRASASGAVARLGARCRLSESWSLTGSAKWESWSAGPGESNFFLADYFPEGSSDVQRVRWSSTAVSFGGAYRF